MSWILIRSDTFTGAHGVRDISKTAAFVFRRWRHGPSALADIDTLIWPAAVADVCKRNQAAADGARTKQNNAPVKMRKTEKSWASALIEMIPFLGGGGGGGMGETKEPNASIDPIHTHLVVCDESNCWKWGVRDEREEINSPNRSILACDQWLKCSLREKEERANLFKRPPSR